ncbi:MAG: hypothetical protein WCG27_06240 [Pseudomonadota bacterium]
MNRVARAVKIRPAATMIHDSLEFDKVGVVLVLLVSAEDVVTIVTPLG